MVESSFVVIIQNKLRFKMFPGFHGGIRNTPWFPLFLSLLRARLENIRKKSNYYYSCLTHITFWQMLADETKITLHILKVIFL